MTITRLDRLARNNRDLLDLAERMVLTVFAVLAELERAPIIDRTRNNRQAAMARSVKFGPRPALTAPQLDHARQLIDGRTVKEVASSAGSASVDAVSGARGRW